MYWLAILLTILVSAIKTETPYAFICGEKGETVERFAKTDKMFLCLHFMPYKVRLGFNVTVDEYAVIEIPDSFSFFSPRSPEQTLVFGQLEGNLPYSEGYPYLVKSSKLVQNVMHMVIEINEGKLVKIGWDNKCYGCGEESESCQTIKSSFVDYHSKKTKEVSNKVCTQRYCDTKGTTFECNLKVDLAKSRFSSPGKAKILTATNS